MHVVHFDVEITAEVAAVGDALRDPADRAIVATARAHRLHLAIIESKLVSVVEGAAKPPDSKGLPTPAPVASSKKQHYRIL
jgi:hypothetical protein